MIIFFSGQFCSFHFDKQQTCYFYLLIYLFTYYSFIKLVSFVALGIFVTDNSVGSFFSYSDLGCPQPPATWSRASVPQPVIETRSRWWEHQILTTRPVMDDTDPGPSALQERIPTKMESSETSKVFTRRKKGTVCVDRHTGSLRESVPESSLRDSLKSESPSVISNSLRPHGLLHTRLPCISPTPEACSSSRLPSWWCHPTFSSPVIPFSSCLQSFPASESFLMSQFFSSGGQSIEASASASVLPMNAQDWLPLGWTGLLSLQSKRLSRVFSNTTVLKHPFFGTQLSL